MSEEKSRSREESVGREVNELIWMGREAESPFR
jgi:hypothetical protein